MYGIIVVNLSMLSTIVTGLAIDAKGPISDMLVKLLDFWSNYAKKILFFRASRYQIYKWKKEISEQRSCQAFHLATVPLIYSVLAAMNLYYWKSGAI